MPCSTRYSVRPYRGKPTIFADDNPIDGYTYCNPLSAAQPGYEEVHRRFVEHGCKLYMAAVRGGVDNDWHTTAFWTDDNVFPEITDPAAGEALHFVRQIRMILSAAPDARFWIRFQSATPPVSWRKKHPDDLLLDSFGKRFEEPSLASDRYVEQVGRYIENVVRFCSRQPWADRVVGYIVYPLGEGTTVLTCEGSLFDRSPVMIRAFRDFLRKRYGTDDALQAAWGKAGIALASVEPPDDRDWKARGETRRDKVELSNTRNSASPHRLHWPDPMESAAERDYCLCMRELTKRYLSAMLGAVKRHSPAKLAGIDAFKQTMLGWPLVPRWTGDYQSHQGLMHAVSGAFGMGELLDDPQLDVVATPHDYLNRGMGFGYEGEGIGDAVVARGKMMLMEEDQRTYLADDGTFNPLQPGAETAAGLWRNLGASLSRGYNTYPCEMCSRGCWFNDDPIQKIMAGRARVQAAATRWQRREAPGIVMVIDDWSVLEEEFTIGYQYLAVIQQRLFGLARCGVPFRLHLLEDLARDDFPDCHKLFIFPNLFRVDEKRLDLIRRKVLRNGNVALFGPASGITNGRELSEAGASELTGIPLELIRKEIPRFVTLDRFDHPLTSRLPRLSFGDSLAYGPLLVPVAHPQVKRLGGIQLPAGLDGIGLALREFGRGAAGNGKGGERGAGDYASVFSCAVPLPEDLLRELARFSGTHVYGESDDVICADSCTLTVHSVRPGPRRISLPGPTTVWDLVEERKLGEGMTAIEYTVVPPQTRLFYLGDNPFA
jgi:hypothetical protein